jgi:hypothetical protein
MLNSLAFLQCEEDGVEIFSKMEQHLITATLFIMLSVIGFLEIGWGSETQSLGFDIFLWGYVRSVTCLCKGHVANIVEHWISAALETAKKMAEACLILNQLHARHLLCYK